MVKDIVQTNGNESYISKVDVKGLSVAIILATDSSKIRRVQRAGRVIRLEDNKLAYMFNLVLNHTQDLKWFANGNTVDYETINEQQLDSILSGNEIKTRKREIQVDIKNRF